MTETGRRGQSLGDVQFSQTAPPYQTFGDELPLGAPAVRLAYGHTVGTDSYLSNLGRVSSYEATEHHQHLMVQMLVTVFDLHDVYGDADNVLAALFRFNNPAVSAVFLLRECELPYALETHGFTERAIFVK